MKLFFCWILANYSEITQATDGLNPGTTYDKTLAFLTCRLQFNVKQN